MKPVVSVVMGSDSDMNQMREAAFVLDQFHVPYEMQIVSAHRTPEKMQSYAKKAHKRGVKVIIAGAGGAAHLPGMIASYTLLPVIGVPIQVGKLKGLDALLSIAQMPKGVPVATVSVDNAFNAGLLAVRILAIENKKLAKYLGKFKKDQVTKVKKANQKLKKR